MRHKTSNDTKRFSFNDRIGHGQQTRLSSVKVFRFRKDEPFFSGTDPVQDFDELTASYCKLG